MMTDAPLSPVGGKPLPPRSPPLCLGWNRMLADFFKSGHRELVDSRLEQVVHYLESRSGNIDMVCTKASFVDKVLIEYTLTAAHLDEAVAVFSHAPIDIDLQLHHWVRLLEKHSGKLSLKILAIRDGTGPPLTPMLVVCNTDPDIPWRPGYIESWLISVIWHQSTVATKSLAMRTIIKDAKTGEPFLGSPVIDFGVRGSVGGPMCGLHASAAALGGFAYLMVSDVSDNVPVLHFAQAWGFCGPLKDEPLPPSILATEHSVMTSYSHDERIAFSILLSKAPDNPISIVMDAYDLFAAIDTLGLDVRDQILAETVSVVIRPDAGNPLIILPKGLTKPVDYFGTTETDGGYALLNPSVMQGDDTNRKRLSLDTTGSPISVVGNQRFGIDTNEQRLCLDVGNPCLGISIDKLASIGDAVIDAKFGLANLTFGSGSGLIQSATRDTLKFVYKAPACYNKWVMMMSTDRSTDPGMKSNAGLLTVECHNGVFTTVAKNMEDFTANQATTIFKTYYEDGLLVSFDSLKEMCARISQDETRWIGTEKVEDNERKRKMPASL